MALGLFLLYILMSFGAIAKIDYSKRDFIILHLKPLLATVVIGLACILIRHVWYIYFDSRILLIVVSGAVSFGLWLLMFTRFRSWFSNYNDIHIDGLFKKIWLKLKRQKPS